LPQVGPLEILVILVVAPVVLGPKKLPEIGRQVARGVGEFRNFQPGIRNEVGGAFGEHDHMNREDVEDDQPRPISAGKSDHPPRYEPTPADTTS
jgi:sec-independent protein translocase protein TatA